MTESSSKDTPMAESSSKGATDAAASTKDTTHNVSETPNQETITMAASSSKDTTEAESSSNKDITMAELSSKDVAGASSSTKDTSETVGGTINQQTTLVESSNKDTTKAESSSSKDITMVESSSKGTTKAESSSKDITMAESSSKGTSEAIIASTKDATDSVPATKDPIGDIASTITAVDIGSSKDKTDDVVEPPSKKPRLTVIGPTRPPISRKDKGKQLMKYDFYFRLKRGNHLILLNALGALSDPQINPNDTAVMEVGVPGFDVSVYHGEVHAFLRLDSTYLDDFECENPVAKMVSLAQMFMAMRAAPEDSTTTIYVFHNFDHLTMEFDKTVAGKGPGTPFNFELRDVDPMFPVFPDVVQDHEIVIPTSLLTENIISNILATEAVERPEYVILEVQPATVNILAGLHQLQTQPKKHDVMLRLTFWEALHKATVLADECTLSLVTHPPESIMLLFKLSELDDMVVFKKGDYISEKKISCLVFLISLQA